MIIIFDGPEKAGKTTLIAAVKNRLLRQGISVAVRKWGKAKIDDREYSPALREDTENPATVTLWDRGWPSEHVYGNLLGRHCRLANDPWLGEWLHSRAADIKFMVLPLEVKQLYARRDKTDLPVDPLAEATAFEAYADRFHWNVLWNAYTEESDKHNVDRVMFEITYAQNNALPHMTLSSVSKRSNAILFVQEYDLGPRIPGAWLPFTDDTGMAFARQFGDSALAGCWADSQAPKYKNFKNLPLTLCIANADADVKALVGERLEELWNNAWRNYP